MSEHTYLTREELSIIGSCRPTSPIAIAVHRILSDLDALRAELKAAQEERDTYRLAMLGVNDAHKECKSELDLMRKALEDIDQYIRGLHRVPEVMWNDAIAWISETVFLALNPQPAQPEKA